jgi:DNA-binding NtrC family response regulator
MMFEKKLLIFLIDDDALFLKSLEIEFLANPGIEIHAFATGEICLENLGLSPDIIILDYNLNGIHSDVMNGLETLDEIKKIKPDTPVIMLSSQDQIEVAVNCMKHQAFDYIVKSETAFLRLQKAILQVIHYQKLEKTLNWYMQNI